MNIVFFGTAEFAIPSLIELHKSRHKISAVVTQPDRKKGRDLKISPPPTKVLAASKGIPVFQSNNVSDPASVAYLRGLNTDLFVVIAFGQILNKDVLSIPKLYSINLHGSLLPKYRGAAPTNWAVINGDRMSGITIIKMNERMDEGDIILKKDVAIDAEDTNITLSETLSDLGAKVLVETLDKIENGGKITFTKQDDQAATYAPKLKKEDGLVDWNKPALVIHNRVRGLLPWPSAYTHYDGNILKILKTEVSDEPLGGDAKAGEAIDVLKGKGIIVKTASGNLVVQYLQLEGKRALDADAFVRGQRISKGYKFS